MSEPGAIGGRIVNRSGAPLAGARVMIGGDSPTHADLAAVTGDDGDYQFGGLVPGVYEIHAYGDAESASRRVRVEPGEVARLDLSLDE